MPTTPYPVLPPERTWPEEVETCAQALVDGADGDRSTLAALSLLFREPSLVVFGAGVQFRYVTAFGHRGSDLDWIRLYGDVMHGLLALEPEPRAVVLLACCMVSIHCPVRWAGLFPVLSRPVFDAFLAAAAYMHQVTR